jgi:hypothetical protein
VCVLAIWHRCVDGAPVVLATNREERWDRPAEPPRVWPGSPAVLAGRDPAGGGTWLGVNAHGVVVAVTNRRGPVGPPGAPSRGMLCRDALAAGTAREAADLATLRLATGRYAGVNVLALDAATAEVVHGGARPDRVPLAPGPHALTSRDVDDPDDPRAQRLLAAMAGAPADVPALLTWAAGTMGGFIKRLPDRGTVSSTILAATGDPGTAAYWYAPGAPDRSSYVDRSGLYRAIVAGR